MIIILKQGAAEQVIDAVAARVREHWFASSYFKG
jgi:hypothetical protein